MPGPTTGVRWVLGEALFGGGRHLLGAPIGRLESLKVLLKPIIKILRFF
jgi:hypothetical protein